MTGASRTQGPGFATLAMPNLVESIRPAAAFVVEKARMMMGDAPLPQLFEAAVVEAVTNAFEHGNTAERSDSAITCEVECAERLLTVRILDQGHGFALPDPSPDALPFQSEDAAAIPDSGFGLVIIRGVFPVVRTFERPGQFGVELSRPF